MLELIVAQFILIAILVLLFVYQVKRSQHIHKTSEEHRNKILEQELIQKNAFIESVLIRTHNVQTKYEQNMSEENARLRSELEVINKKLLSILSKE